MSPALALLRCSIDGGQDVDHQERAAHAWAARNGFTLEVLREIGISGCAKKRPGLDAVLARCRHPATRPAAVWVRELSRLGRSLVQVVAVLQELDSLGVRVVVESMGLDYGTPQGRLMAQVVAAFAEFEREMICERTRSGLAAARARGVRLGKRPDRWDADTDAEIRRLLGAGLTPSEIHRKGAVTVWRPVVDRRSGAWTEKPVRAARTAIYQRCRELRTARIRDLLQSAPID